MFGGNFGGTDACQGAPGRRLLQQLHRSQIVALLQNTAAQTDGLVGRFQPAPAGGGPAFFCNFGNGGEVDGAPVKGADGFHLGVGSEQRQLELLYGIPVLMADQCQFHKGSLAGKGVQVSVYRAAL